LALAALCALAALAPAATTAQQAQQPVQITTTKFGNNFYAIDGQGGRMGALVGPDGIFLVDAQFPQVTERIVAALRQISNAPIKYLVNTHVHGDHTGGNENFAKLGATIISRPLLRQRLANPDAPASGGPAPAVAPLSLPAVTYDTRMTVRMNGEAIELIPLPLAHTDGDTAVRFPGVDVLMTGDVFRSIGFPYMSPQGGTMNGMLTGLATLESLAGPNTVVIPGHGPIVNREALTAHRVMAIVIRDRVAQMVAEGRSIDQVLAAKVTADYDEKTGNVQGSADRFVRALYEELSRQRATTDQ
jgi:glyoxylase-like metal-dependent hydrolase (beta-lactamase superfamily II)